MRKLDCCRLGYSPPVCCRGGNRSPTPLFGCFSHIPASALWDSNKASTAPRRQPVVLVDPAVFTVRQRLGQHEGA